MGNAQCCKATDIDPDAAGESMPMVESWPPEGTLGLECGDERFSWKRVEVFCDYFLPKVSCVNCIIYK